MNGKLTLTGFIVILLLLQWPGKIAYSQNTEVSLSLQKLNQEIETLKKDKDLKHASWSICVKDIETGKVVTEYNSDQSLIPASTMKAVTTGAALSILGGDFRFKTKLEYDGYIDSEGTLHGNLFVTGGGDPTIGSTRFNNDYVIDSVFNSWLKAIKSINIKKIEGLVIADAQVFGDELIPSSYLWIDIGNYYAAGTCGLILNENLYHVIFKPGNKVGDVAEVLRTEPVVPDMKLINYVTTGKAGSGDQVYIYGSPYSNTRFLRGTVPYGEEEFGVKGSIPDPGYFFALSFNEFLVNNGIDINKQPSTVRKLKLDSTYIDTTRTSFLTHLSPSLSSIIGKTNRASINTYAETILNMLGYKVRGRGTTKDGIIAVHGFYANKGVDLVGFNMEDGSGLSRMNYITTNQLTEIFKLLTFQKSYNTFYESLAIAGKSGTMKNLCKGTVAQNNLRAKTGSLSGVRAFAGYVNNRKDEQLVFAVIANNYTCSKTKMKKKLEKLLVMIAQLD